MKKSNTVKVTMNLTDRDLENTDKVREAFHARSNAAAVSSEENTKIEDLLEDLMDCHCDSKYSIEPHGDGYALYWGRCDHRHGYNVLHITECSRMDILKMIEDKLNM